MEYQMNSVMYEEFKKKEGMTDEEIINHVNDAFLHQPNIAQISIVVEDGKTGHKERITIDPEVQKMRFINSLRVVEVEKEESKFEKKKQYNY